jgi:hypothetical protein
MKMKIWVIKAVIQKLISFLPFKHNINYLFQRYVTKGVRLTDEFIIDRATHAFSHFHYFRKYHSEIRSFSFLELGTGWYPVVPVMMYLFGADLIYSVDISSHIKKKNFRQLLIELVKYLDNNKTNPIVGYLNQDRTEQLRELLLLDLPVETYLEKLCIKLLVTDARKLPLPDNSIDLITSNNTFEHIPSGILKEILKEFKRIAKKNSIMSHFIDMSDHFAHLDKTISIYNFLQFSEKKWKLIDNSIQPQNRLRINQYRNIYKEAEISIEEEKNQIGDIEKMKQLRIANFFNSIQIEELAICHSQIVSRM